MSVRMAPRTGPRLRKPSRNLEHIEAVALMRIVSMHCERWPELRRLFAVPNGGARSAAVAGKLKAEGVKAGVPDYILPVRRGPCPGLALELKSKSGRGATEEQQDWLAHFAAQGWRAALAYGAEEAWEVIRAHMTEARAA